MPLNSDPIVHPSPPAWLVCNGNAVVGPVQTELLLRGVMHGRVPSDSMVREVGWQSWRQVGQIREVRALQRMLDRSLSEPSPKLYNLRDGVEALTQATDMGEALLLALHAVVAATSATVGLAHRVREPLRLPTTSCVFGRSPEPLGHILPWFDPAFSRARSGALMLGAADAGAVERAVSARLGGACALQGVAMLPITIRGALWAMLELGRSDHPFRLSDAAELGDFAIRVGAALARLADTNSNPK